MDDRSTLSRRQLLKILIAAGGGATAASLLPVKWSRPVVQVGVLPAHAQVSPITYRFIGCNVGGGTAGGIGPHDTIYAYADIGPARDGIQLRCAIVLNDPGHPLDGQTILNQVVVTDTTGRARTSNFNLGAIIPTISSNAQLVVTWQFVNPGQGTGTCQNIVDIL